MNSRLIGACALVALQILAATSASSQGLLRAQGHIFRWGAPGINKTQIITYAILNGSYAVPGGKSIVSPDNCGSMNAFSSIINTSPGVTPSVATKELRDAFAAWESVAAVKFVPAGDAERANIVVGASGERKGRAFTNLAYLADPNAQPIEKALGKADDQSSSPSTSQPETVAEIEQAYVCLNPALPWKAGFDGDLKVYDLKYTFIHEIGHAIGLDHPGKTGAVMAYRYDETVPSLTPTDIAAVQSIYGPNRD
ncbi:MAG: matrixin family metalloprotease [Hyphomicrobiaceae bacterium]